MCASQMKGETKMKSLRCGCKVEEEPLHNKCQLTSALTRLVSGEVSVNGKRCFDRTMLLDFGLDLTNFVGDCVRQSTHMLVSAVRYALVAFARPHAQRRRATFTAFWSFSCQQRTRGWTESVKHTLNAMISQQGACSRHVFRQNEQSIPWRKRLRTHTYANKSVRVRTETRLGRFGATPSTTQQQKLYCRSWKRNPGFLSQNLMLSFKTKAFARPRGWRRSPA